MPWRKEERALDVIDQFKKGGWTVAALEITDTPSDVSALSSASFPLLLVVGNEVDGVAEEVLAECDIALELPQYGAKQSLNVSVATGVVCYDLVRQFRRLSDLPLYPSHDQRDIRTASSTSS